MVMSYLCDTCRHMLRTVPKTYTADGILYREEYAECARRWTRPKVKAGGKCFDYERREQR